MPNKIDYQAFTSHSLDLMCVATLQGYFEWVNPSFTRVLGWTEQQLQDVPFLDFVHPDDIPGTLLEMEKLSGGVTTISFTNRYRTLEDTWCWLEWTAAVHEDLIYANARDVSERIEEDLRKQERAALLEMTLTIGNIGHWTVDLVNNTVTWSDVIYRIYGVDRETYTPELTTGIDAYHPDDRERVSQLVDRAIQQKTPFSFELRLVRPTGEIRHVMSHGMPQLNSTNEVIGIFGVFRDITDDPATQRQHELEQLASLAAHDLREPVRTIHAYLELMADQAPEIFEIEPLLTYRTFVQNAAFKLNLLVANLLRFSEAGQRTTPRTVNLTEVFETIKKGMKSKASCLHFEELPKVIGDHQRFVVLFSELVDNALRHSQAGDLRITVRAIQTDGSWQITIEDNGIGLPTEHLERAFKPFQRLYADAPGTSIGLAVARQIARASDGRIWLESAPGRHRVHVVLLSAFQDT